MTTRFVSTIAAGIFAVLIATPGFTCTTLCLFEKGRALVAYNYDAWASEGLVLVNKRGTSKKGHAQAGGELDSQIWKRHFQPVRTRRA